MMDFRDMGKYFLKQMRDSVGLEYVSFCKVTAVKAQAGLSVSKLIFTTHHS